jgi:hypothetical protein
MTIYLRQDKTAKHYKLNLTRNQVRRYDNGAMISCGLSSPADVSTRTLNLWIKAGIAVEVDQQTWNHSGCQSSCTTRGDASCRW